MACVQVQDLIADVRTAAEELDNTMENAVTNAEDTPHSEDSPRGASRMNHETLWAREGDRAFRLWPEWSPLASSESAEERSNQRRMMHGFDFRVESVNGTKTMIKEEAP